MPLLIEQFVTAEALADFESRQQHTLEAIGVLGMDGVAHGERPATAFGGGASAMQGVDTYLPGKKPFDLDIVASPEMFTRLGKEKRFIQGALRIGPGLYMGIVVSPDVPLPVDVITSDGSNPYALDLFLSLRPAGPAVPTHEMAGIHVTDAAAAALSRLATIPRVKDPAGVLKSHFVAEYLEHPITARPEWQATVAFAKRVATRRDIEQPRWRQLLRLKPKYPSWLNQLIDVDFDHPAFSNLDKAA